MNINFKTEYSPKWIKPKKYDFYFELNNKKYIVEMDGGLGHGKKVHSKSNVTIEETQRIDDFKDRMAKDHNVEVIRIDCEESHLEYIKNNILMSRLYEIIDLNNVDWIKIEENSLTNLVKKVCEIKRDNPNMSTVDIGKITKISSTTIKNYLNRGCKIWDWFEYNPREIILSNLAKGIETSKKKTQIYKNNNLLGTFNSCTELIEEYQNLFNIKLCASTISKVCHNKIKCYKGFTFKYIE